MWSQIVERVNAIKASHVLAGAAVFFLSIGYSAAVTASQVLGAPERAQAAFDSTLVLRRDLSSLGLRVSSNARADSLILAEIRRVGCVVSLPDDTPPRNVDTLCPRR